MNALVTGATSGIGFHVAAALASAGMRVLVTGRDPARAAEARSRGLEVLVSDASRVGDALRLADEVRSRVGSLDVLVNNAGGGLTAVRTETTEGLELNLAMNFVVPFALTRALLPALRGRVVNVVSSAFGMWKRGALDDVESRERYVGIEAHAHAKLLEVVWGLALARRLEGRATVHAVNPGMAWTPGTQALSREAVPAWKWIWPVVRWFQKRAPAERAARGPIALALGQGDGEYFDALRPRSLPARLRELSLQDQVWSLGESLIERSRS